MTVHAAGPLPAVDDAAAPLALVLALAALAATLVFALVAGSGELGWSRVLAEIGAQLTGGTSPLSEREAAIVWELRMPRVLLAGLVGAALAGAGAAFQGVFRNPLADPYLLGAAAGAGMAATIVVVFAPRSRPGSWDRCRSPRSRARSRGWG
ncbi:iron chelate uptake ABC transporter family permease subunit [Prauserella oleivorans]